MKIAILGASDADAALLLRQLQTRLGSDCSLSIATPQALQPPLGPAALVGFNLVLLLGLEFHSSPQLRQKDQALRTALNHSAIGYALVQGNAAARLDSALQAIDYALGKPRANPSAKHGASPWQWACEKCSDPACEHRLFSALRKNA